MGAATKEEMVGQEVGHERDFREVLEPQGRGQMVAMEGLCQGRFMVVEVVVRLLREPLEAPETVVRELPHLLQEPQ